MIIFCRYCFVLKEGFEIGSWVCDWCRVENEYKLKFEKYVIFDMKEII